MNKREKSEALLALTQERAEQLKTVRYLIAGLTNEVRCIRTDMNGSYDRRLADLDRRIDVLVERRLRMARRHEHGDELIQQYRDRIAELREEEARLSHVTGIAKLLKLVKQINELEED